MGDFFQISTSSVDFLLASISKLIENALPVLLPLLGLFIAWIVIEALVGMTHRPKTFTYTLGQYVEKQRQGQSWQPANFLEPRTFELSEEEEEEEFEDI